MSTLQIQFVIFVGLIVMLILYKKGVLDRFLPAGVRTGKGGARGGLEEKVTVVGSEQIPYLEGGSDQGSGAVVLLLHGLPGDKELWSPLALELVGRGYRVLAPDLPGFGASFKTTDTSYDPTTLAKAMRGFSRRTDLQALHVVAHSFGCMVAAGYAYASPTEFLSLTLIEPMNVRVPYQSDLDRMLEHGRNPMLVSGPSGYETWARFVTAGTPDTTSADARARAAALVQDKDHYRRAWEELHDGPRANLLDLVLPEIKTRTLVVLGGRSRVVHDSVAKAIGLARGEQTTAARVVPTAGHLPHFEKPDEVAAILEEFFKGGR